MLAVGMLLIWAGYGVGLEGWSLFKDYDITLGQLMSPFHPYSGPWPPPQLSPNVIWPGGRSTPAPGAAGKGKQPSAASKFKHGASVGSRITSIINQIPGLGFIK